MGGARDKKPCLMTNCRRGFDFTIKKASDFFRYCRGGESQKLDNPCFRVTLYLFCNKED